VQFVWSLPGDAGRGQVSIHRQLPFDAQVAARQLNTEN
jgi:hypothetical protein